MNTKRSKMLHMHIKTTPETQISVHFTPALFELQAIWRQVHQMTPKSSLTPQS